MIVFYTVSVGPLTASVIKVTLVENVKISWSDASLVRNYSECTAIFELYNIMFYFHGALMVVIIIISANLLYLVY